MGAAGNVTIRCQWKKHFEVEPGATGIARVLCRECRRHRDDNATVIHHIDLATGAIIRTKLYQTTTELFDDKRRERETFERMARS